MVFCLNGAEPTLDFGQVQVCKVRWPHLTLAGSSWPHQARTRYTPGAISIRMHCTCVT